MSAAPTRVFRTRKGRIRFKSGGELHLLPSARERRTRAAHRWLDYHVEKVRAGFADDLAGYLLIAWDTQSSHQVHLRCYTRTPGANTLPQWAAEAVRRHSGEVDTKCLLDLPRDE